MHRDIKPENILLESGHAIVADFGIARAITAAGGDKLTETGIAVGTPAYMSPEQAPGKQRLDGRSDVYSLACVLYEMLSGEPPYGGPTPQAILARRLTDPVPPLSTVRETVPAGVEQAIVKALAKLPADRFATAAQFAEALAAPAGLPALSRRALRVAVSAAALAGVAIAVLYLRPRPVARVDPNLIAVLPFRVAGADPALDYLREGMVDLLAINLTGAGGPRALDPRAILSAWGRVAGSADRELTPEQSSRIAREFGAGRFIDGGIVGTPGRLVITAAVTRGVRTEARATVQGPLDSLPALVDRLTAQLLATESGEGRRRLDTLTSLPALRAYLEGRTAYRRGRWVDAIREFDEAVRLDSTFALAAMGLAQAWGWYSLGAPERERAIQLTWWSRDRLNRSDQVQLETLAGPRYPASPTQAEILTAHQKLVGVAPDRAEAWFGLGDQYYHWGRALGIDDAWDRAATAFRRAVGLDSGFAAPLQHLTAIAGANRDTSAVRRFGLLALAVDSATGEAEEVRWLMAVADGDSVELARVRARLDRAERLPFILALTQEQGIGLDDAERIAAALRGLPPKSEEQPLVDETLRTFALNRGRPSAAIEVAATPVSRVLDGLYGDGDTVAAAAAARILAVSAAAPLSHDADDRRRQYRRMCVAEHWALAHGDVGSTARTIGRLRGASGDSDGIVAFKMHCAILLEAWLAVATGIPEAGAVLARLDSAMLAWPVLDDQAIATNLVIARLQEARGNLAGALAAVRRRLYGGFFPRYLSTYLREEGRLAALTGDRDGAIRAYQHYLALRSDPEPALRPEAARVRAELASLLGEARAQ